MKHEKINYLEFPARDLNIAKGFFSNVFNWTFTDYGSEYVAFGPEAGLDGGFYLAPMSSNTANGAALVVFYSNDLASTQAKVEKHGGTISRSVFEFPGGRRFHFTDPNDNEFAVWSDK